MKIEVCQHCDNCDPDTAVCSRYTRPIWRVKCCGIYAAKKFNKPFNGKGVKQKIEFDNGGGSPLHLGKSC